MRNRRLLYDQLIRKLVFFMLSCFVISTAVSQTDSINHVDVNGLKQGVWLKYYSDGTTLKLRGEYLDDKPYGKYTKYYENGKIKETGIFKENHYVGERKKYAEFGQTMSIQHYDEKGNELDTSYFYDSNSRLLSKEVNDSNQHINVRITYNSNHSSLADTLITVVAENRSGYSLLSDFKLTSNDTMKARQYTYKLTYETTPIFRDHLLTLYNDSTYSIVRYVYESCYNYIDKSYGTWNVVNGQIVLKTANGFTFNHVFDQETEQLVSEIVCEIDRKYRKYVFVRVH